MKKYIKLLFVVFFITLGMFSCTDLDKHFEGGTIDDEQFTDIINAIPSRIDASANAMYTTLGKPDGYFNRGRSSYRADDMGYPAIALGQDLNSGDMTNPVSDYDWFSVALEWSDRTPQYANPTMRLGLFYRVIYAANDVIRSVPDDVKDKDLIYKRGQAKAMRAFSYLSLAPYFQFKYKGNEDAPSVPMMLDGIDPRNNPRAPLRDLYASILQDLTDAIADLEGFKRPNKGIVHQNVAYGLRARANLYMENWAEAAADATEALKDFTPYEISDLTKPGFNDASDKNWMWALLLPTDAVSHAMLATWPSQLGSFAGEGYVAYAGIYRCINVLLYDKIPDTDVRKGWWLNADLYSPYLDGLVWRDVAEEIDYVGQDIPLAKIAQVKEPMIPYTNVKFGQKSGIGSAYNDGDWCMMRAEEMILIKAEATGKSAGVAAGIQILTDFVKTYRDPKYACTASSIEEFENAVWLQRRIELWGEGFAMADVMRLGKNVVRFHPGKETNVPEDYQFNVEYGNPWMLLRFVQGETTNNPAVVNNTGGTQPKQNDGADLKDGVTD